MPSRLSAEPGLREERERLLTEVREKGYSENYRGIRISATGRRFRIDHARVWMLQDKDGTPRGQAATFAEWEAVRSER